MSLAAAGLVAGVGGLWMVWTFSKQGGPAVGEPTAVVAGVKESARPGDAVFPESLAAGFRQRTVDFCAGEVTLERSFVIFRNGTCVLVHEPSENPLTEAMAVLAEAAKPGAVFATATGADGATMVTYRERLFQRFSKEDIDVLREPLKEGFPTLMTPGERLARDGMLEIPESTKLGLLGRAFLMQDAEEQKPLRIIRERRNHTASVR